MSKEGFTSEELGENSVGGRGVVELWVRYLYRIDTNEDETF